MEGTPGEAADARREGTHAGRRGGHTGRAHREGRARQDGAAGTYKGRHAGITFFSVRQRRPVSRNRLSGVASGAAHRIDR